MSDSYLNPKASPDGLEGSNSGVRRLNKLPIVIGIGVITVVISVMAYAAHQRANRHQVESNQVAETVQPRSAEDGAKSLLQGYEEDGTIPPADQGFEDDFDPATEIMAETPQSETNSPDMPMVQGLDEKAQQRLERAQKFREDLFYDAVVSDTAVKIPEDSEQGQSTRSNSINMPTNGFDESAAQKRIAQVFQASKNASSNGFGESGGFDSASSDPNLQARKDEFQKTERTYGYSTEFRREQLTPYEIRVGTVIPAVMIGGINSDLPGQIIAQVSQNVRDTKTGKHVLIPQGSKLIGTYDSHIAMGQSRVMVGWHRIQFPDGSTLALGNMGGTDQEGYSGFKDKVNNHYWRIFGNATLLSLISAGAQLSQPESDGTETSANEQLAAELGRQWGQVGQQMTRRNLNIQPTIEIRPGYRFNVMVNKDLILRPDF